MSLSNMGRCDLCGRPIDMEHAGDDLVIYEEDGEGYPEFGITVEDMRQGFAEALTHYGGVENEIIAEVYVEDGALVLHADCAAETALNDVQANAAALAEEGL